MTKVLDQLPDAENLILELIKNPSTIGELEEQLEVSRSTIHRKLASLRDSGLIMRSEGTYQLTNAGSKIAECLVIFEDDIQTIFEVKPFLNSVDQTDFFDLGAFLDPYITIPDKHRPHKPINRYMDILRNTEQVKLVSPVVLTPYVDTFHREVVERGLTMESILEVRVFNVLKEDYSDRLRETLESGQLDVSIYPDEVPCGLTVFDDRVSLTAHDETGKVECLLEDESSSAVHWGEQLFEEFRRDSENVAHKIKSD